MSACAKMTEEYGYESYEEPVKFFEIHGKVVDFYLDALTSIVGTQLDLYKHCKHLKVVNNTTCLSHLVDRQSLV